MMYKLNDLVHVSGYCLGLDSNMNRRLDAIYCLLLRTVAATTV